MRKLVIRTEIEGRRTSKEISGLIPHLVKYVYHSTAIVITWVR